MLLCGEGEGKGVATQPDPAHSFPTFIHRPALLQHLPFSVLVLFFCCCYCYLFLMYVYFFVCVFSSWVRLTHSGMKKCIRELGSHRCSKDPLTVVRPFLFLQKKNTAASASEGESHSESLRTSVSVRACVFVCVCVCYVCVSLYGTAKCVLCASVSCLCLRMSVSGGERQ